MAVAPAEVRPDEPFQMQQQVIFGSVSLENHIFWGTSMNLCAYRRWMSSPTNKTDLLYDCKVPDFS